MNPYKVGSDVQWMGRRHRVIESRWDDVVVICDAEDPAAKPRTVTAKDLSCFNNPSWTFDGGGGHARGGE